MPAAKDIVYVGSFNLDIRRLNLNYELRLRFADENITTEAREIFERALKNCQTMEMQECRKTQTLWTR